MNETQEAYVLAGIGVIRGLCEMVREEVTLERIENIGLVCAVGSVALAGYAIGKTLTKPLQ